MAGLIPQPFIDDLLDRLDIVEVIDKRVGLKKAGRNYKACCPFHNENTPSFNVNPDKQFYHCFGCGAGGNAVGFVMDFENIDFPAAVESLAAMAGMEVPREENTRSGQTQKKQQQKKSIYDALRFSSHFFQSQLRKHPDRDQAISYLKKRGLSGEVARDFAIGFAPAGWDNLLKAAQVNGYDDQQVRQLEAAGMLVKKEKGGYYDRFRERIIFPIRDNRGRIIAFGGRVLGDDTPKYLNSPETDAFHKQRELYGLYESRKANPQLDYLLLVEGYMDVVSLFQYGISRAVATLGTASSTYHLEKIFRHTSQLIVCFDGDSAGQKAAQRLMETSLPALKDGREIKFLFLPDKDDPDTFIRKRGKEAFLSEIEKAKPLEVFLIEHAGTNISLESDAGKARLSQQALPLIQQLPNGIFKQRMLTRLGDLIGVTVNVLNQQLDKVPTPRTASPNDETALRSNKTGSMTNARPNTQKTATKNLNQNRNENAEQLIGVARTPIIWAISTLLYHPEFALNIELPAFIKTAKSTEARLLNDLYQYIITSEKASQQAPNTPKLLGHFHKPEESTILSRCVARHPPAEQSEIALQELKDTLSNMKKVKKEEQIQELTDNISSPSQWSDQEKEELKDHLRTLK